MYCNERRSIRLASGIVLNFLPSHNMFKPLVDYFFIH